MPVGLPAREQHDGIVVRGLARRFGARWALAHVDVSVDRGAALMIVGANGSGKTTLLRCLATALRPHAGTIELFGQDLWQHRAGLRPRIALLTHAARLYDDLSARENLQVWARLARRSIDPEALLEAVGLPTNRPDPVRTFSAGMRRRVALARATMGEPELVLFDEPFAALDPEGRQLVKDIAIDLKKRGATLVMATHLPQEAGSICETALVLDAGRVQRHVPTAELRAGSPA